MTWNWNERPSKAAVKYLLGGDDPRVVYAIGKYEVTVPGKEREITYRVPSHSPTDPRQTMPNMEITDGEIRIPVTDLVSEVLSRLDPVELAQALWQNVDVRSEFIECMVSRYSQMGINDPDRRAVLRGLKEAVHSAALDRLANRAAAAEFDVSRCAGHWEEIRRINHVLRDLNVTVKRTIWKDGQPAGTEDVLLQFNDRDRAQKNEDGTWTRGVFEVGGQAWNEAREFWRQKVLEEFPGPAESRAENDERALP